MIQEIDNGLTIVIGTDTKADPVAGIRITTDDDFVSKWATHHDAIAAAMFAVQ